MASLDIEPLIAAARDLIRGGRWATAQRLLDAAEPSDPYEAGALAAARADAEVDHAFWTRREPDPALLATARERAADPAQAWTVAFAQLRGDYASQLFAKFAGGTPQSDELLAESERLAAQAPDTGARAYATFYRGLIAGVLRDEDAEADKLWQAALDTDDEYVRSYGLRHLGGLADEAGRRDEALALRRESTRLRQRVGFVPGVLAQLALEGDSPIVADWADALGIRGVIAAASATEPEVARDPA